MNKFWRTAIRLVKYASSSLIGTAVDMLVLWLCSDYLLHGYVGVYIVAPCISFEFGVITNFFVAQRFVWCDRVLSSPQIPLWRRLAKYNLSCIFAFCVRVGISLLLHHYSGWDVVPCNLIAMLFSGIVNFTLQTSYVFGQSKKQQ